MLPATEIFWDVEIHSQLQPTEWPEGTLEYMEAAVIRVVSDLRRTTRRPWIPSPVPAAHVRHRDEGGSETSRHYVNEGYRLSDATDGFVRWADALQYVQAAMRHARVGGLGVYDSMMLRGEPGDYCMLHVDTRPQPVWWIGHGRDPVEYIYFHVDPQRYFTLLGERLK